jgi:hypothetical protein
MLKGLSERIGRLEEQRTADAARTVTTAGGAR